MKILQLLFYFSPKFLKNFIVQQNQRRTLSKAKSRQKVKVTKLELAKLFNQLNIDADVFVHSSLMDIGKLEGGFKETVKLPDANVLAKQKTLLFSALAFKGSSEDYLKNIKVFDLRTAPVAMGVLNEYYADLADAERSMSPTHSVVSYGVSAHYYTAFHHLSETPFDENSPYFRIAKNRGKILMFGASLKHLTFIHVVEDLLGLDYPVSVYASERCKIELINKSGDSTVGFFRGHSSYRGIFRNTNIITKSLRSLPSTQIYPLGCSELILLDAREVILNLLELLRIGQSAYGKVKLSKVAIDKIDFWLAYFKSL